LSTLQIACKPDQVLTSNTQISAMTECVLNVIVIIIFPPSIRPVTGTTN